jgi:hypothetical protein
VERVEELLREEFGRTTPAIELDAMLDRVATARRRRAVLGAGLAVVVLAAATTAAVSLNGASVNPPGEDTRRPFYSAQLINVVFTSANEGFVLQEYCGMLVPLMPEGGFPSGGPTPDIQRRCRFKLLVTADAGATWHERTLPAEPVRKDTDAEIIAGHSLMLWRDEGSRLAFGGVDRRYWTTVDGGVTWQESAMPRDVGPPGSVKWFGHDDRQVILATPPPDGETDMSTKRPLIAASDGSVWKACHSARCVRVTRDLGQTWKTLPTIADGVVDWMATTDGQTIYAAALSYGTSAPLLRSTDGGQTWSTVPAAGWSAHLWFTGLALPNGDLAMVALGEGAGVYQLSPDTGTLQRLTGPPANPVLLYRTGGWLVASSVWNDGDEPIRESIVSVSPDNGTTWRVVPPPTGA